MKILDCLPYSTASTTVAVPGGAEQVRPYQIIVHVSISVRSLLGWELRTPKFPAILDTGNNHNFSIGRSQLIQWAGIQPEALPLKRNIRERQRLIPLHAAALWIHRNVAGERVVSSQEPYPLKVEQGIAIYPDETGPRLPVLGLRVLTENELHLAIDGQERLVWLRSQDWRSKLIRWLS